MAQQHSRRFQQVTAQVDRSRAYKVREAIEVLKSLSNTQFDETVEIAFRLGVDPRKAEENVRGTLTLPNGTGRVPKVAVIAKGEAAIAAEEAGADVVGGDEIIARIEQGWEDFDILVAHVEMMRAVGRLGKRLGPRMPNKKSGTATDDVGTAVRELKAGKIEYRVDRQSNVHAPLGKVSFETDKIVENFSALLGAILAARPSTAKGVYLKQIHLCSTMGPGLRLDLQDARVLVER